MRNSQLNQQDIWDLEGLANSILQEPSTEVDQLKKRIEELESKNQEQQSAYNALLRHNRVLSEENTALRQKYAHLDQEYLAVQQQNDALRQQNAGLTQNGTELLQANFQLTQEINKLGEQIKGLRRELHQGNTRGAREFRNSQWQEEPRHITVVSRTNRTALFSVPAPRPARAEATTTEPALPL